MKRGRKPLPKDWIQTRILVPGALAGLNDQARGITLTLVETGCRPSELCNLEPEDIFVDDKIPFVHIRARADAKVTWSERRIPLIGVAMEVFRQHPDGFPRYRGKAKSYAATANKYLKGLWPTSGHSLYSLRLSFEERMIEHSVDLEMRAAVMGYRSHLGRPLFVIRTEAGRMYEQALLSAMAFDFDPAIV